MADLPTAEFAELRSAAADLTAVLNELTEAKRKETGASNEAAEADKKKAAAANTVGGALGKFGNAALGTANAVYGLAKTFASIAESGRQFAEKTGATATRGAQFQLDINKIVLQDAKRFGADQQVVAEQIRGAATSFADVFVGAAAGMQISARGSAEFARSLNVGFKSEFQLTAQSMKALVTVGAATTKEFDAFRKASGRAGLSSGQFANLVNKNSLSFMLYGPSFARAAVSAERLGINLASVQKAQESMVTNLDGTIDTIAQLNQLGANIDFGSLVTMAETQGPEATLKYLQSTIPPSLFQSASTRALISKLGIPLEDLLKRQGSKQESAADRIEQAFSEVAAPAGAVAKSLANLNKDIMALEENKVMAIMNGVVSVGRAIWGLFSAMIAFGAAVVKATFSLLGMSGAKGLGPLLSGISAKFKTPIGPKPPPGFKITPAGLEKANFIERMGQRAASATRGTTNLSTKFVQSSVKVGALPMRVASAAVSKTPIVGSLARGTGKFVGGTVAKAGAVGNVGGVLAGLFGAIDGYNTKMGTQIKEQEELIRNRNKLEGKSQTDEEIRTEAKKKAKEVDQGRSLGAGTVQGGAAAAGTIAGAALGTALAPFTFGLSAIIGPILGGLIGNLFGKTLNKYFPSLSAGIGVAFGQLKESFAPVKEAFSGVMESLKPLKDAFLSLFSAFGTGGTETESTVKKIGDVFGYILKNVFLPLNLGLQAIAVVIRFVVDGITMFINTLNLIKETIIAAFTGDWSKAGDALKSLAESTMAMLGNLLVGLGKMASTFFSTLLGDTLFSPIKEAFISVFNWILTQYNRIPFLNDVELIKTPEKTKTPETPTKKTMDDGISRPGYGNRMLVTPTGRYALHNNDNVIAYANDLADGVKMFSYGALSPRKGTQDTDQLTKKVDQLIAVLTDAKTTIQVGDSTQQVPRMSVARVGAYERFGRPS
jgi:uncharacterized membrane protein/uncharacterized protein YfiM (DUF2279 family)